MYHGVKRAIFLKANQSMLSISHPPSPWASMYRWFPFDYLILDQDFRKEPSEILLRQFWGSIPVKKFQPTIGFGDGNQKLEGAVGPPHRFPLLLQCKRGYLHTIVGIHRVTKLKVVVNNLRVHYGTPSFHVIDFLHALPYISHYLRCAVRRHAAHDTVQFFHAVDMKLDTIQLPCPCIDCADLKICKVCLDDIALNNVFPLAALLDKCQGKHCLLSQLDYSFQDAEPTVKYNKLGSVPQ